MISISYKYTLSTVAALLAASSLFASEVVLPTTFEASTTAKASEVNGNFTALQTGVNDNNVRLTTAETNIATKQNRVSTGCDLGSSIRVINSDGSVVCEVDTDTDTDTDTTYSNGTGLSLSGTTFSVNTSVIQQRVIGTCAVGSSIRSINSNGTVTCETDTIGTGDITGVTAGAGLAGGGTSGEVTVKQASGVISLGSYSLNSTIANGDPTVCQLNYTNGYTYFRTESTSSSCGATENVNLPDLSTITEMTCSLYQTTGTSDPYVSLIRTTLTGGVNSTLSQTVSTVYSTSIQTITDTTISNAVVDNSTYSYYLSYTPADTATADTGKRFYSCSIKYSY